MGQRRTLIFCPGGMGRTPAVCASTGSTFSRPVIWSARDTCRWRLQAREWNGVIRVRP